MKAAAPQETCKHYQPFSSSVQGSANCTKCANFQDGLYCVHRCPQGMPGEDDTLVWKYPDVNNVCQLCHKNCTQG